MYLVGVRVQPPSSLLGIESGFPKLLLVLYFDLGLGRDSNKSTMKNFRTGVISHYLLTTILVTRGFTVSETRDQRRRLFKVVNRVRISV